MSALRPLLELGGRLHLLRLRATPLAVWKSLRQCVLDDKARVEKCSAAAADAVAAHADADADADAASLQSTARTHKESLEHRSIHDGDDAAADGPKLGQIQQGWQALRKI